MLKCTRVSNHICLFFQVYGPPPQNMIFSTPPSNLARVLLLHGSPGPKSLGTPVAPSYANIFMAALEEQLLLNAPNGLIPFEWIRFIDDIFAISGLM